MRCGMLQQFAHLLTGLGQGNAIGKAVNLTAAHGQPIGQALASGVAYSGFRIEADKRVSIQPRRWHLGHHVLQAGLR